ncbi:subclass B3 metallo-beta-lactamase [Novosphingobium sp. G106]|uniref:subclass B3 metallo-beta-lactamase n=1 Tax=Novosphingobium sp. G106 TaxID=2849500 RepID=UPI001C2D1C67|nr:subclass B3 metallo-beta-lactamase [Novosphingobium sp. G106]MBV1687246.1 subclass B3 metallo-beta-lactamase [Novosphingobium sp. G106]
MRHGLLLGLAAFLAVGASPSDTPAPWSRPQRPFHVVGPIYYVGTEGIAAYLIQTRAGLILLDGGLEESVPLVERNIAALGFRLRDVKLMIATHAHYDHVAALAGLKRDTGAAFASSPGDRGAYETGTPPSQVNYGVIHFPALKVDRVLADGRPVTLGGVSMTPVFTPGHTPGCTSWTMRVTDTGRPLDVVFLCSLTVAGNKLVGNKGYPGIVADYRRTFARVKRMHADVVLPGHSEQADVIGRAQRRDGGNAEAFVDPALLPRIVAESEAAFDAALKKEQGR